MVAKRRYTTHRFRLRRSLLFSLLLWHEERIDVGDSCITTTIEWDVHNEAHESCVAT